MTGRTLFLAAALHAALLPAALLAQDAPAGPARFATEIVVTPERDETPQSDVPASTIVLDAAALGVLPSSFLGEAMTWVPGFLVARGELHAGRPVVSARGFFGGGEAEYVLLLVDGVPAADVESGLIDWSTVPLAGIRRVEALRGAAAAAYGDAAIGGVIQVLTDPRAERGHLMASGGSFGTMTADGAFSRRIGGAGVDIAGAARRSRGFAAHAEGRHYVGRGTVDGRAGGQHVRVSAGVQRREHEDPGALPLDLARSTPRASDPLFERDEQVRNGGSASVGIDGGVRGWGYQLRASVSGRSEDAIRTIRLAPQFGDTQARALSSLALGGSAEADRPIAPGSRGVVRVGLDLWRERLSTAYAPLDARGGIGPFAPEIEGRRVRVGAFVSAGWSPVSRVRVSGAVRFDGVGDEGFGAASAADRGHTAWSPRAGVTVSLNEEGSVTAFAQVSRAFKAPTLDQLFDPRPYPDFAGGAFTISNRQLVPQRAASVEGGVSRTSGVVRWSALAYRMTVDDEIDFDVRTFRYGNIAESRHTGAEIEAGARLRRVQPFVTYAFARVVGERRGLQLKNVPRHAATAGAAFDLPWGVSGSVRYRVSRGAFLDDENTIAIDGPSAIDVRLRRAFGPHAVYVDVLNAADDRYEEFGFTLVDAAGRPAPYGWPGAPRAVRAGVQLGF